jgi:hypothetical protein
MHTPECRTVTTKLLSGDPEYDCDCGEVSAHAACKSLNELWLEAVEEEVPETYRDAVVKRIEREWDGR